jgi:guanyl-specific ribonuclease Sa
MSHRWTIRLLALCCLWAVVSFGSQQNNPSAHMYELAAAEGQALPLAVGEARSSASRNQIQRLAPNKAYNLLAKLQERGGAPLPGYVGGREFQNREGLLPHGRYREYDVNRKVPGRSRDAERIVIEQTTGKAYYTGNHYRTFVLLN